MERASLARVMREGKAHVRRAATSVCATTELLSPSTHLDLTDHCGAAASAEAQRSRLAACLKEGRVRGDAGDDVS
jgi:hypothetical protein